jgi:hypothetical protein
LIERFNERFARAPARPGDLRRPLKVTLSWLVTFNVVARFMQEALEMRYMWQVSLGRVSAATVGQAETEFRGTAVIG